MARLVTAVDFERVLRSRSRATTAHFALHHLMTRPGASLEPVAGAAPAELSTTQGVTSERPVDDLSSRGLLMLPKWLGAVVPKRHARRAVTRALLKRQIYAAAERHRDRLAGGLWVVRQRAPFERALFPSAASDALKLSVRAELEALFETATR